jgi:hypothetical protein
MIGCHKFDLSGLGFCPPVWINHLLGVWNAIRKSHDIEQGSFL